MIKNEIVCWDVACWQRPVFFACVDTLIGMKIVGHTDYKTTANIYTHVRDEMLRKATVNMGEVFGSRASES